MVTGRRDEDDHHHGCEHELPSGETFGEGATLRARPLTAVLEPTSVPGGKSSNPTLTGPIRYRRNPTRDVSGSRPKPCRPAVCLEGGVCGKRRASAARADAGRRTQRPGRAAFTPPRGTGSGRLRGRAGRARRACRPLTAVLADAAMRERGRWNRFQFPRSFVFFNAASILLDVACRALRVSREVAVNRSP